jgi:PAS domain S-box-containing protein
VCVVTYRALNSFADTAARVARTHQVQAEVGHLQRALAETFAARRNYSASPGERELENLRNSVTAIQEHLGALRRLTADDANQRENMARLHDVLVGPLARAAELLRTPAPELPAPAAPAAGRTTTSSDEFIHLLGRINAAEETRLQGRQREAKRNFDLALAVVPIGTSASVLLLSIALFLLNRAAGDRKRAQIDLLDSERRHRLLFESSPLPMWVFDLETLRFVAVNAATRSFYGYTRDEFLAMSIVDIRPPDELEPLREVIALPPTTSGFKSTRNWRHRKKDGTITLMEVTTHDLVFDGRPARLVLANDVTARVQAEEKLAGERALLRTVINLLPDFVYVKDRDSRLVTANAAYAKFLGAQFPDALSGRTDEEFYPADAAASYRRDDLRVLEGSPIFNREECVASLGNEPRFLLTTKVPLCDPAGNIIALVGTGRDISAAKAAETAIRQLNAELELRVHQRTEQLENAIKELESFSYSVSHDLRAPLRHVQGYVAMLQRATEGQLSEKAQRHLKTITAASTEMGQLIDDLLEFSRMGRMDMSEARVALDDLVRETVRGQELSTHGRKITWKISTLPDVVGDAAMLRQVLANLVANAIKYTRQRDPAEIDIGCAGEEDGRAILYVRDNGAGFDMQYVHKLFGVFQRLHRADEFEGTGIGLATVRRVVARHGGRVWADGALNRGATFYFTLRPATLKPVNSLTQ